MMTGSMTKMNEQWRERNKPTHVPLEECHHQHLQHICLVEEARQHCFLMLLVSNQNTIEQWGPQHPGCHNPAMQALCIQLGAAWGITVVFMTKHQWAHGAHHKPCLQALCVQLGAAQGITEVFMTKCQWVHSAHHKPQTTPASSSTPAGSSTLQTPRNSVSEIGTPSQVSVSSFYSTGKKATNANSNGPFKKPTPVHSFSTMKKKTRTPLLPQIQMSTQHMPQTTCVTKPTWQGKVCLHHLSLPLMLGPSGGICPEHSHGLSILLHVHCMLHHYTKLQWNYLLLFSLLRTRQTKTIMTTIHLNLKQRSHQGSRVGIQWDPLISTLPISSRGHQPCMSTRQVLAITQEWCLSNQHVGLNLKQRSHPHWGRVGIQWDPLISTLPIVSRGQLPHTRWVLAITQEWCLRNHHVGLNLKQRSHQGSRVGIQWNPLISILPMSSRGHPPCMRWVLAITQEQHLSWHMTHPEVKGGEDKDRCLNYMMTATVMEWKHQGRVGVQWEDPLAGSLLMSSRGHQPHMRWVLAVTQEQHLSNHVKQMTCHIIAAVVKRDKWCLKSQCVLSLLSMTHPEVKWEDEGHCLMSHIITAELTKRWK